MYNFCYLVVYETDRLLRLFFDTLITIEERERQKQNYSDPDADILTDGFATLFLNRVNFSGVIKGGPIGGLDQSGTYKLNCRFNKEEISRRIEVIAQFKSKIKLYNRDASYLIRMHLMKMKAPMFLNIDPPYVIKGSQLYTNFFTKKDHLNLQKVITKHLKDKYPWIVTYDDCPFIREIYGSYHMQEYNIAYNAGRNVQGKELVITNIPTDGFIW